MKLVLTNALFLREEIDLGWVFLGKPDLKNDLSLHETHKKCTRQLADYLDYQVQMLSSKLGCANLVEQNNVQVMVATPISKDSTIVCQLCLCPLLTYFFCSEWFKISF